MFKTRRASASARMVTLGRTAPSPPALRGKWSVSDATECTPPTTEWRSGVTPSGESDWSTSDPER
eukprot:271618-Prorocentrum_minimum.AAC.2